MCFFVVQSKDIASTASLSVCMCYSIVKSSVFNVLVKIMREKSFRGILKPCIVYVTYALSLFLVDFLVYNVYKCFTQKQGYLTNKRK